ncbi:hypothetical protein V6N13_148613 [Hibiscus sabdariffa]
MSYAQYVMPLPKMWIGVGANLALLGPWSSLLGCATRDCLVINDVLWGTLVGLEGTWDQGFRQVILEIDSLDALRLLRNDSPVQGGYSLLMQLQKLQKQGWIIRIQHIAREGNIVEEGLAKEGFSNSFDVSYYLPPPSTFVRVLSEEMVA